MKASYTDDILNALRRDSKSGLFCRFGEWLNAINDNGDLREAMRVALCDPTISANAIYRYAKDYPTPSYAGGVSVVKAHCAGQCRCPR